MIIADADACIQFRDSVRPVLRYMEEQLAASSTLNMRDEDIINMMSGDGGSQVDVVLYLIDQGVPPEAIRCFC